MASDKADPGISRLVYVLIGCALSAALVCVALATTVVLQGVVSTAGYIFFYTAVVISSWFGGKWAGSLAVILSIVSVDYFFVQPLHAFEIDRQSLPLFIEFAASAAVVAWFSSWRKYTEAELEKARDQLQLRVEERTFELQQSNQKLVAEMAERKRAEDAYYQAQAEVAHMTRMSALGELAASISHEVNQPLAAVVTNADACMIWLSSEPPNLEEARAAVDSIAQQGTRASEVVRKIRAMFTKAAPERTRVSLNDLIGEVSTLMEAAAFRNEVSIEMQLEGKLPATLADPVQLQQLMMNLILNGIEAMSTIIDRPRRLKIRSEAREPDRILIAVQDTGIGIDAADAERMFDSFFTTKSQGMGMGLSISRSIVEAHGGRLWASANSDYGSTFQFTLPTDNESSS